MAQVTEHLPTYEQAITHSIPPPDYCTVAAVSTQSPFKNLYQQSHLKLNDLNTPITTEPNEMDYNLDILSFNTYTPMTETEIENCYASLAIVLKDKVKQIDRNIEFIQKKVKTRTPNFYIDRMRTSSCADFQRIKSRIIKESQKIEHVFDMLTFHNAIYMEVTFEIQKIKETGATEKTSIDLMEKTIYRGRIIKNLEIIKDFIAQLSDDYDVSYVLKERAKIYNDAKEFVRRQTQSN